MKEEFEVRWGRKVFEGEKGKEVMVGNFMIMGVMGKGEGEDGVFVEIGVVDRWKGVWEYER